MNAEQEVQDLRRKYADLDIRYRHLLERIQRMEETLNKVGALELVHENRIRGLEQDFDKAATKSIETNRKLQDQINHLSDGTAAA